MSDTKVLAHEREQWGSRAGFIFASVGAAVGFGNVWRFPALAYDYGGKYVLFCLFVNWVYLRTRYCMELFEMKRENLIFFHFALFHLVLRIY